MPDNKKEMGNDAQRRNRKIKKIERIEVKANETDNEDKLSKKSKAWRIIRADTRDIYRIDSCLY